MESLTVAHQKCSQVFPNLVKDLNPKAILQFILTVDLWDQKILPNSPCPLFGKARRVTVKERGVISSPNVVRICQAPVDDIVDTPYLRYVQIANKLGALDVVHACCPFCACVGCCLCTSHDYKLRDADREGSRRADMRAFDARVKHDCEPMRIMYN